MNWQEPRIEDLPHACREGVWPVPCDDLCPEREQEEDVA